MIDIASFLRISEVVDCMCIYICPGFLLRKSKVRPLSCYFSLGRILGVPIDCGQLMPIYTKVRLIPEEVHVYSRVWG